MVLKTGVPFTGGSCIKSPTKMVFIFANGSVNSFVCNISDNLLLILYNICALTMLISSIMISFKFAKCFRASARFFSPKGGHSEPNCIPKARCIVTPPKNKKLITKNVFLSRCEICFKLTYQTCSLACKGAYNHIWMIGIIAFFS
jgi:hypothetical protein